jgi:dCMP deaminase
MTTAYRIGKQSRDPERQVGCLIVHPIKGIMATGYNRIPHRLEYPGCYEDRQYKLDTVIHAEEDAIVASRADLNGTALYCTRFTCHECAKLVIASGIDRVFAPRWELTSSWVQSFETAYCLYRASGVEVHFMRETLDGLYDYEEGGDLVEEEDRTLVGHGSPQAS